jgi:putative aldouronate transport system substrate-binding protein
MNAMVKEGLIASAYVENSAGKTESYLENDNGFMHYDYNQTQTVYNETKLQDGEKYMAVLIPVAHWFDGTEGGVYMRFTESWRSVKTDGWGISAAGVAGDDNKLHAALALIDYAYSEKGMILMSYGPDAFIKTKADGSYVTFNFNGTMMPAIADATYEELWTLAKGNYTDYARKYLGSTLSFAKSQAFEYQCTHEVGKEGAGKISTAIGFGIIKHPELAITENPWYTSVPTVLPNTKDETAKINELKDFTSSGTFSQSKDKYNVIVDLICNGYEGVSTEGLGNSAESAAAKVAGKVSEGGMGGETYLIYKNDAWERLVEYYEDLNG